MIINQESNSTINIEEDLNQKVIRAFINGSFQEEVFFISDLVAAIDCLAIDTDKEIINGLINANKALMHSDILFWAQVANSIIRYLTKREDLKFTEEYIKETYKKAQELEMNNHYLIQKASSEILSMIENDKLANGVGCDKS